MKTWIAFSITKSSEENEENIESEKDENRVTDSESEENENSHGASPWIILNTIISIIGILTIEKTVASGSTLDASFSVTNLLFISMKKVHERSSIQQHLYLSFKIVSIICLHLT